MAWADLHKELVLMRIDRIHDGRDDVIVDEEVLAKTLARFHVWRW